MKQATPYNKGTSSGWSGSDTSKDRADTMDSSGTTGKIQQAVIRILFARGERGATWTEVSERLNDAHHGTVSGALSVLHKTHYIERLAKTRNGCKVYVMPEFVDGRMTEKHGRKPHPCPNCGYEG